MLARIYQPVKSAMQSGKGCDDWLLEYESSSRKKIESLMGYTSTSDMRGQIQVRFSSCASAIDYAKSLGLAYRVIESKSSVRKRVSYSDNFRYDRRVAWTH